MQSGDKKEKKKRKKLRQTALIVKQGKFPPSKNSNFLILYFESGN